ncbi:MULTISPECIES: ABC transporter ATP-binding protein [unclassified Pseudonocardia]|uniref:ABC transporter ATP-binding protein n=1 Tax=unclassified Pseudonocardia TaxID=2619320 RepID=UPI001CF68F1A|nr:MULTISPECIES: ABC transporter ATP-binding protein [unclassified Pseudonocardia]
MPDVPPVVELDDVDFGYAAGPPWARVHKPVLEGFSLRIEPGETVGLVGESGSGKSTVGKLCLGLLRPASGQVRFTGAPMRRLAPGTLSVVLQHPQTALNPRLSVERSVAEPLVLAGVERDRRRHRVREMLEQVGLDPTFAGRYPGELSGGQRQRVSIARALVTEPRFVLFDEAVSALDVSVQAQILNLVRSLQDARRFGAIFISHDLRATRYVADRILVMRAGTIVDQGSAERFYTTAEHDYTRRLQLASDIGDRT